MESKGKVKLKRKLKKATANDGTTSPVSTHIPEHIHTRMAGILVSKTLDQCCKVVKSRRQLMQNQSLVRFDAG